MTAPRDDSCDATLPPLASRFDLVCPICHAELHDEEGLYDALAPGCLPRCPTHGLAYVRANRIAATGCDTMLGQTVAGRFTVLDRLGVGSMGAVYRARQEAIGRDVALKIVRRDRAWHPEARSRFEREARATSALASPHTVTVFDFGEAEDGAWFLAMELMEGETVGERLRRVGRVELPEALHLTKGALRSLSEAHGKGIIHRDLKPDNLFIVKLPDQEGEICKVLDFGIAKFLRDEAKIDQLETQAGTVFGTPRYMSPEQAQGNPLDARSDIYSLGVILFQMLTGRPPFLDDDAVVVMARHIRDAPPRIADRAPDVRVPAVVEDLLQRVLAKDPGARPSSADELINWIERIPVLSAGVTGAHSWSRPTRDGARARVRLWIGVGGLLGIAALGGAAWATWGGGARDGNHSEPIVEAAAIPAPSNTTSAASESDDEEKLSETVRAESSRKSPSSGSGLHPVAPQTSTSPPTSKPPFPVPHPPRQAPKRDVERRPGERYGRFE